MPTLPQDQPTSARTEAHQTRGMAESFGVDAERYDRARPRYPDALIERIVTGSPGPAMLDVGCGTGIEARQLQAAGATMLGVEPDARMAHFAQAHGVDVEVATFEAWEPSGRSFDAVVAGQSWHWVDPAAGALKAAHVLRGGGRLVLFGHVFEPPDPIADAFAVAYRRAVPDSPFPQPAAGRGLELYEAGYSRFADHIRQTGHFDEPERWRFDWTQSYTRDQWLDLLTTTGGLTRLGRNELAEVLGAVGAAIDSLDGRFTMHYTTLAIAATRTTT